ncbi:uricase [Gloeophyllum trabeum ATCC 11539]|uniref:Uricase n=1 Tax=Gloeophyllum trabeum (strain ATCC 11539 / FP-39264 / Madison 617) TaxID=670483 RepID=S7Q317_GLOTA|nr:uricase [Gloeophyllum trabeum ATCC 11539]EPQ53893.1 uricase [Gloeophyllum trabeum ATCC 11539]
MSATEPGTLSHARYGKDLVRVLRVVREGSTHHVVEYNVKALVEGDIATSYTKADNSVVVATDSIKNITYYIAKTSPHVLHPTRFALHIATFLLSKYPHLHKAFVDVERLRWTRIPLSGQGQSTPHPHSFYRDGDDKQTVSVEVDGTKGKDKMVAHVRGGMRDLLVLKSTGSAFRDFVRDEFTTLLEVPDRIFSTSVDLEYAFGEVRIPAEYKDSEKTLKSFTLSSAGKGDVWDADFAADLARKITLDVFATDESESVQATLYKMAQTLLNEDQYINTVTYKLPNKHYVPVDMRYIGVDNVTPTEAEVFTPLAAPSGLITATVTRK